MTFKHVYKSGHRYNLRLNLATSIAAFQYCEWDAKAYYPMTGAVPASTSDAYFNQAAHAATARINVTYRNWGALIWTAQ